MNGYALGIAFRFFDGWHHATGKDAVFGGLTHTEQIARHEVDTFRRLVTGHFQVEHTPHLTQTTDVRVLTTQLVTEFDGFHPDGQVNGKRSGGGQDRHHPQHQEGTAFDSHDR